MHLKLKHNTTPEELWEGSKSPQEGRVNAQQTPQNNGEIDQFLNRTMSRLEKMFFIKILTDATTGRASVEDLLAKMRTEPEQNTPMGEIMDAVERISELRQGGQAEATSQDPIASIITGALQNPEVMKMLMGALGK